MERATRRWMSKDRWVKNTLWWGIEVLYVGNFLLLPLLPQAKWFPQENCLESLTYNSSILKAQGLVPEEVQNKQVTRVEWRERGMHWKWSAFPAFEGVWGSNLPHELNECCKGWPEMSHLEWFWQGNLPGGCKVPTARGWVGFTSGSQVEIGESGNNVVLSVLRYQEMFHLVYC